MSTRGLRAILCFAAGGSGLWAVAAGALTHHPVVSKVGAVVAVAGVLAAFAGPSQARELTASDLQRIEAINQAQNRALYSAHLTKADPACAVYATNKAWDLMKAGYAPSELRLAIVRDEHGAPHEVAEVVGTLKGKPVTVVLDSRFSWTLERKDAEAVGYVWAVEFQGVTP